MTNHTPKTTKLPPRQGRASPKALHPRKARGLILLGEVLRGLLFGGAAFLLGSCPLFFGSAPLGIALLSASSAYTWYIWGGLLLSAFLRPISPSPWAWVGVYSLCVILRLVVRFFVDPPVLPDGRPCGGRTYLLHCWASFKKNTGLLNDSTSVGDTFTNYYEGSTGGSLHERPKEAACTEPPLGNGHTAPKRFSPHLFMEHPFLLLPHIELVLADGQKHRNVLFRHNVSLPENRILRHATDDLCDVMAQDRSFRIHCFDEFHDDLLFMISFCSCVFLLRL